MVSGISHFLWPGSYIRIIPPSLPWPKMLVALSGAAEVTGGVGLLLPRWRRAAAYGLVALLVAVFPANIYMALAHVQFPGWLGDPWVQWMRLPLQLPLIWWALRYTKSRT